MEMNDKTKTAIQDYLETKIRGLEHGATHLRSEIDEAVEAKLWMSAAEAALRAGANHAAQHETHMIAKIAAKSDSVHALILRIAHRAAHDGTGAGSQSTSLVTNVAAGFDTAAVAQIRYDVLHYLEHSPQVR